MNHHKQDEVVRTAHAVKDEFGVDTAKVLIESFGVRRVLDVDARHADKLIEIGNAMIASRTKPGGDYEAILWKHVVDYATTWKPVDPTLTWNIQKFEQLMREREHIARFASAPAAATTMLNLTPPQPGPNDLIAVLLDIAASAEQFVKGGLSNSSSQQVTLYHKLADSFSPLLQVQDFYNEGPTKAASRLLRSFVEGRSVTITGQQATAELLKAFEAHSGGDLVPGQRFEMPIKELRSADELAGIAFNVRSYDDAYVHSLVDAVADISTDGRRFRALMWLFEQGRKWDALDHEGEPEQDDTAQFVDYLRAAEVMDSADPKTPEAFRATLDTVSMMNVVPDTPSHFFNLSGAYDKLLGSTLKMSSEVVNNYRTTTGEAAKRMCKHCGHDMPEDATDTLTEQHGEDCIVLLARQLIEDAQ